MKFLTTDEHRVVVERLVCVARDFTGVRDHAAGFEYTSLMACFLMHSVGAAESLLTLHKRYENERFPATTGYVIVRSLFEVDVTAHYLSRDPSERSRRYIDYEHVITKGTLEAIERHRASESASWREGLQLLYNHHYAPKKAEIEAAFGRVRDKFVTSKGKPVKSWSGKTIREMAEEVDHAEAYHIFYADLSSFAHVNIRLANRFLRSKGLRGDGPVWTQRSDDFDVGQVFRYAATFLTCFLELFGKEFSLWDRARLYACWDFPEAEGRDPR